MSSTWVVWCKGHDLCFSILPKHFCWGFPRLGLFLSSIFHARCSSVVIKVKNGFQLFPYQPQKFVRHPLATLLVPTRLPIFLLVEEILLILLLSWLERRTLRASNASPDVFAARQSGFFSCKLEVQRKNSSKTEATKSVERVWRTVRGQSSVVGNSGQMVNPIEKQSLEHGVRKQFFLCIHALDGRRVLH